MHRRSLLASATMALIAPISAANPEDGARRVALGDLSPGSSVHLMPAWSHAPDFDHHSAWRGYVDAVL